MPNRYSQYATGANYSPESFKDLAVVPIALRQRHDSALAAQDDLLLQLNNIQVRDEDRDYYNQKREEITAKVDDLTNKINTIGAGDSNLMGEFRNMKRAYNQEVSLTGGLGQAADIKKRIDDTRAKYLEFGVKQGFSPKTTQANFDIEYNKFNQNNPSDNLGKSGFAFGEFTPTFAPKQIEAVSALREIQPLIGEISQDQAWQSYQPIQDPNTGLISYVQTGGKTMSKSNLERLKSVESFINQKLMNPESDLRQSLAYSRPGEDPNKVISDFIKESDFLLDAMKVQATGQATQIEPPKFDTPKTGKSSGKSDDEPANLVSTPTGQETFEGKSYSDIVNQTVIKDVENKEQKGIATQEDIDNKNLAIRQKYRIDNALKDPNTKSKINEYLRTNGSVENGTLETYKKYISTLQNQIDVINKRNNREWAGLFNVAGAVSEGTLNTRTEIEDAKKFNELFKQLIPLKEDLDDAMKESIPLDDLKYSKKYTFGPGEAGKKTMDIFNANATDYGTNWIIQLQNAGGLFTLPGETDAYDNKEIKKLDELKQVFSEGVTKFTLGSIIDSGSTGSSQLELNYTTGTGDKTQSGMIVVDYDNKSTDTSVIDQWMIEMQKTLDPKGQAVIQSIIDNKQLRNVSVDNNEFAIKGFSKSQSETIKLMSNTVTDSKYKNNDSYKSVNYNNVPNRDYNIVLNNQGYYDLYMKDNKSKNTSTLSAASWLNKEFTKDYIDKTFTTPNPLNSTDPKDRRNVVDTMKDFALIMSEPDGLVMIDGGSSKYNSLRDEYITALNSTNDLNTQYQLTVQFYNEIKPMRISHKNKKRLL